MQTKKTLTYMIKAIGCERQHHYRSNLAFSLKEMAGPFGYPKYAAHVKGTCLGDIESEMKRGRRKARQVNSLLRTSAFCFRDSLSSG
jgi:hypothetical protein